MENPYTPEAYELCKRLEFKNMLNRFDPATTADSSMELEFFTCNDLSGVEALFEKAAQKDQVGISVLADYFLIAHGNSDSQVNALVENVEEQLHKAGYPLKEREGQASGKWVLMDFGDVIIHVFDRENRLFYNLERIWKDGKEIPAEEL